MAKIKVSNGVIFLPSGEVITKFTLSYVGALKYSPIPSFTISTGMSKFTIMGDREHTAEEIRKAFLEDLVADSPINTH